MEPASLVVLSRTLRLLITIQDLASTNKALRDIWQDRENTCLTFVRDIVAVKLGTCELILLASSHTQRLRSS